jgi:hypothetical protein
MTAEQNEDPVFGATPDGKRTLNRRTLIKGAAAAGAAAWAAPVIIDSMASPAAATTKCYSDSIAPNGSCSPAGGDPCCTDLSSPLCNASFITAAVNGSNLEITLHGGCTFTAGSVIGFYGHGEGETNDGCHPGTISGSKADVPLNDGLHGLSHACVQYCCHS